MKKKFVCTVCGYVHEGDTLVLDIKDGEFFIE